MPPLPSKKSTASGFADWVFRQHHPSYSDFDQFGRASRSERLARGSKAHLEIDLFLRHLWTIKYLGSGRHSGWTVYFADNKPTPDRQFIASRLRIGHEPMRCLPDLVLVEDRTAEVLIIERKTTRVQEPDIPFNGWPNVEAQLWCYSWIDDFVDSPCVHLIGQLWTRIAGGGVALCHRHPVWQRGDESHEARCRRWFQRYGGRVAEGGA